MDKLNIGIIGCANIAKKYAIKAFQALDKVDKIYISSRDVSKSKECAEEFGVEVEESYDSLINNPDIQAIYIPLPIGLHEEWAIKAASKGKHILCEKSISDNFESVKKIVDACKQNNVVLFENFMCDYHPQHDVVLKALADGNIGDVFTLKSYFGFPPMDKDGFRYNKELGGGSLNDAGAYTVFIARKIMSCEPVSVTCRLNVNENVGVDVQGTAFVEFDGKTAFLGFGFDNVYQNNYSIWGSKGTLTVKRAFSIPPNLKPEIEVYTNENFQDKIEQLDAPACNHFELIFDAFCTVVLGNDDNKRAEVYEKILNQAKVLQAMRLSAKENRKVKIDEIN
jgi:dTDP-3,4-didehydro-2,6-dideoxy-alpha-D-glucose 3-reductase